MTCKDCIHYYENKQDETIICFCHSHNEACDVLFKPIKKNDCVEQMTIEQAIDLLDTLIGMIDDNHGNDYDTALRMAIKALEESVSK